MWRRYGIPLLLYVALGLLWAVAIPPWQGPDEPGHYEYVALFGLLGRPPTLRDRQTSLQAQILRSLDEHDFWRRTFQPRPQPLPQRFDRHAFLQRSGTQLNNERPLYYLLPALLTRRVWTLPLALYLIRLYSLLLGAGVVLAAAWAAPRIWPTRSLLREGVPFLVAVLPMPLFVHTTVNSAVLADVGGALFFALGWLLLRSERPAHRPAWMWLLWLGLGVGVAWLKPSAMVLPLLAVVALLWRVPWARWVGAVAAGVVAVVLAFLLVGPRDASRAAVWHMGPERAAVARVDGVGLGGSAALRIRDPWPDRRGYAAQNIPASTVPLLWGQPLRFRVALRGETGRPLACISVMDEARETTACAQVTPSRWHLLALTHRVTPGTRYVRVVIGVGRPRTPEVTGTVLADAADLRPMGGPGNLLANGDAEVAARYGEAWWQALRRRALLEPAEVYTPPGVEAPTWQRVLLAGGIAFTSFWGNFGWLQYPLPVSLYLLLAGITLGALVGLRYRWRQGPAAERRLLLWNALSALVLVGGHVVPALYADWFPQGRYLFVGLLPLLALGLDGLQGWARSPQEERALLRAVQAGALWLNLFALAWTLAGMYG